MGSPWQPGTQASQGYWQPAAPSSLPNHTSSPPPDQPRRWRLITTVVVINVAAVAATAAITYALSNRDGSQVSSTPSSLAPVKTYSEAEQSAAKDKVCRAFDSSVRGIEGSGGVVVDGNLNVPVVLRKVNSVVAVQNSISPATPDEVTIAAKDYIQTATDLSSAAFGQAPTDEVARLTDAGNGATLRFADVCGLPH